MSVWVIAQDKTLHGKPITLYWDGGKREPVTNMLAISPFHSINSASKIATWPTKREATAAHREVLGVSPSRIGNRVVKLSDEDAAIVTGKTVQDEQEQQPQAVTALRVVRKPQTPTTTTEIRVVRKPQTPTVTTKVTLVRYDPQQREQVRSAVARQRERETGQPAGDPLPADEARKLTDAIRRDAGTLEELIQRAYLGRAWSALGYTCWNAYCDTEFASVRLRLPREERLKMVCRLRELGLSVRAIEAATGASHTTIQKDIAEAEVYQTGTPGGDEVIDAEVVPEPKPVTGLDGKNYPAHKPKRDVPQPTPIDDGSTFEQLLAEQAAEVRVSVVEKFDRAMDELDTAIDRLYRLVECTDNDRTDLAGIHGKRLADRAKRLRVIEDKLSGLTIRGIKLDPSEPRFLAPPGDDESGTIPDPAAAERVDSQPPITNVTSRSPSGRRNADYMAAGRRDGSGKTPRQR